MNTFKEFEAASLDEAIKEACYFYDLPREKLEIEIVHDAKKGVFGLVGARKACIKARKVAGRTSQFDEGNLENISEEKQSPVKQSSEKGRPAKKGPKGHEKNGRKEQTKEQSKEASNGFAEEIKTKQADKTEPKEPENTEKAKTTQKSNAKAEKSKNTPKITPSQVVDCEDELDDDLQPPNVDSGYDGPSLFEDVASSMNLKANKTQPAKSSRPAQTKKNDFDEFDLPLDETSTNSASLVDFEQLDKVLLEKHLRDIVQKLLSPLTQEATIAINFQKSRVDVHVDCGEDSGILIGREGQTLASVQYLLTRLISRLMDAPIRVQLDVGDYRQRQDDRLHTLAFSIAEKVRQFGKAFSTHPMSSYHRRIVHMALHDEEDLQTRSYGEGSMKRVVVYKRRSERA